ncbi:MULTISPECIES: glycoside hydrolase family 15 protein [Parafrankia]|uniref:Trehalase n=1 Tax=Parafrankia soli TaxID=2599596 RepID=A0A1S1PZM1_9ACTN|nr:MULTISPECIES: glycoside hydrolase family 15 protein [Parafrankia]OHV28098.1 glycosyl hydrolase family 15 [Parafrankia soli]TCJ35311.1 glycoside hydrolase family 15 protein [Parafrankia sp. BMG5.11]CAI7977393.1 Trehalase [Frankia sp. Hr75.2]SQD98496.1 Glycoside hydrolase [Parafrankia sp. Ea1.12]
MAHTPTRRGGGSPFPPIAEYGFLSDCETNCLVAPSGNVEWMCVPRPDAPSVFGAVLDRSAGGFRFGPDRTFIPAGRRYLPGTNVLETTWQTPTGWLIVTDCLVVGRWHRTHRRSKTHRRTPGDWDADHVLLRLARCEHGDVDLSLVCEPNFDYGRSPASWRYEDEDYSTGIITHDSPAGDPAAGVALRLRTDLRLGFDGRRALARTTLREGDTAFVAMTWRAEDPLLPGNYPQACAAVDSTTEFWRQWLSRGRFPDHPWRRHLQRSALALKGLTYAPTGALLAAATTSLPETPQGERNWDYRYSWIRDSTFALWGLYTLGLDYEANDFFSFIADVAEHADDIQVMYRVGGEPKIDEEILGHLSGYDGAVPVRVGNEAAKQRQHDVWGAVLDSVYLHTRSRDYLSERLWPVLVRLVEAAAAHWRETDRGMWEVRGEPRHFTSSKMFCWVALDRGRRLAQMRGDLRTAGRWDDIADEIHADVLANGVDHRGVFTQYYGSTSLDASVLLMPLLGFLPSTDDRVKATVLAIADELTVDGLVLRYRTDETDDGVEGEEGAFLICSFWLVSALVEIGELTRARQLCERLLSLASPLDLYAEEIDPADGRHLGNFPQAFTHLALINAVMYVIRAESGESFTRS